MNNKVFHYSEQGLTLIETVVALFIFLIFLGFMMPLFLNHRISTLKNEINTGAVAVTQQILDELRQADSSTLPSTGSSSILPSGESLASIKAMGTRYTYSATITYCAVAAYCNPTSRHITVQVKYDNQTVYTVETAYTRLQ